MSNYATQSLKRNAVAHGKTSNKVCQTVEPLTVAETANGENRADIPSKKARIYPDGEPMMFSEDGCYVLPYWS